MVLIPFLPAIWLPLLLSFGAVAFAVSGMTDSHLRALRSSTRDLFYHGFDNYMEHAYPDDELAPLSCKPKTRNRQNPADIGLNDALGNYSVTLVDSLSSLAILASDPERVHAARALSSFRDGVTRLVETYGDGRQAKGGGRTCGTKACGFDLDSKVQVFETNIRGVGGLISAHLFAVGDLPITGYEPELLPHDFDTQDAVHDGSAPIRWPKGFVYDGQLLRLAHDLAERLLPAFGTPTGLPYPRVNLRTGIPFFLPSTEGSCNLDGSSTNPSLEATETCSAGAGSLVLEFSTLSRLTGDPKFEILAKKAFWAVWERRSAVGLLAAGIDAESGLWNLPAFSGIGAGIDSFFEYALKSHILLSGLPSPSNNIAAQPLDNSDAFLEVWQTAHAAITHHLLRSSPPAMHAFYSLADLATGAPRYSFIDNLSAYYPGLLTLAGELEQAESFHLLNTALWTRYSALPERWAAGTQQIDGAGFRHWAGRPEFIESTWYLYSATKDPMYLHTGEMALRDIRRRCWTKCGWADLGDVVTGERRDRMESFFLGETSKYLYLLFADEGHPMNKGDSGVVFSTEGHPLVIPGRIRRKENEAAAGRPHRTTKENVHISVKKPNPAPTCPAPPPPLALTISHAANRSDLFHAASLAALPHSFTRPDSPLERPSSLGPGIDVGDVQSPTNHTFYPWTLPMQLVPQGTGWCKEMGRSVVSVLTFPDLAAVIAGAQPAAPGGLNFNALQKVFEGILVNSLSNLKFNMVQEPSKIVVQNGFSARGPVEYRIQGVSNFPLGRDEKVLVSEQAFKGVGGEEGDEFFRRVRDGEMVDLVIDWQNPVAGQESEAITADDINAFRELYGDEGFDDAALYDDMDDLLRSVTGNVSESFSGESTGATPQQTLSRTLLPAILPTGPGAPSNLPTNLEFRPSQSLQVGQLPMQRIYYMDSTLCPPLQLPQHIVKNFDVLVIKRGGCTFNDKLDAIPETALSASLPPQGGGAEDRGIKVVIVLSVPESKSPGETLMANGELIRPLLDISQNRKTPLAMLMLDGNAQVQEMFRRAASSSGTFDERGVFMEHKHKRTDMGMGLGVKRRYWFESQGVVIGNLVMV